MKTPPTVFILPEQPKSNDKRERNAFGILNGFGIAAAEYYARKDKNQKEMER